MLNPEIQELLAGGTLTREQTHAWLDQVLFEDVPPAAVAAFLTLLQVRGATAAEVAGFADSLSAAAVPFPEDPGTGIDTCGTGGDGASTFNISTTSALVAASAGARVFKHGNRAATSNSGSADLLETLGVPVELNPEAAATSVRDHGFAFLYARQYHPVLGKVAPIRSTIGFPTVFNLLGPMLNPARVRRQVVGVYSEDNQRLMADTLALRGVDHAMVLHGAGGLDEATPIGPFRALIVRGHEVSEEVRDPADLGLARCNVEDLQVDSAERSAAVARGVLGGAGGPARDAVLLNAALALEVAGVTDDAKTALTMASEAVDSGRTNELLKRLSSTTGPDAS